ncbi:hypothetical protein AQUCO_04100158v1 [Aquilegia coerulea]|uniref:GATA-type domain-containing protein n=1 Tax=Aquilegia coerulea TaxID=218851 RepID=A0A2G5CQG8_AQUCA|nr:hypothetical protein AQUCO_04100158v1 [Aquilegia coerulea]
MSDIDLNQKPLLDSDGEDDPNDFKENQKQNEGIGIGSDAEQVVVASRSSVRACSECRTTKTSLWRTGPAGPKTLCNACYLRKRKMGIKKLNKQGELLDKIDAAQALVLLSKSKPNE